MAARAQLDEALALALKLSPRERIQLIERIASSIETQPITESPSQEQWGQKLVRMMDEIGAIEMIHPEIEDATEWVKQIRHDQAVKRVMNWDETE